MDQRLAEGGGDCKARCTKDRQRWYSFTGRRGIRVDAPDVGQKWCGVFSSDKLSPGLDIHRCHIVRLSSRGDLIASTVSVSDDLMSCCERNSLSCRENTIKLSYQQQMMKNSRLEYELSCHSKNGENYFFETPTFSIKCSTSKSV